MPGDAKKYTLKVFSGPHLGAEILLDDGEYTIGRDDECDIIFYDESVSSQHLSLSIQGEDIRLSPGGGVVYLDGEKISQGAALSPYQMVAMGTTHFAIGLTGESWPALNPLEIVPAEGPVLPTEPEPTTKGIDTAQPAAASVQRGGKLVLLALIGLGFLFLALFTFLFYKPSDKHPETVPAQADNASEIKAVLQELGLNELKIVPSNGDALIIRGYVEKQQSKKILAKALREKGLMSQLQVYSAENILTAAKSTIAAMGLDLQVNWLENGRIAIEGQLDDNATLNKTLDILKQDIKGIREIDNQVAINEPAPAALAKKSETPDKSNSASPSKGLSIRAISIGQFPYITMADGNKYFIGAELANGYIIKQINEDSVILTKGGSEISYNLGGE